MKSLLVKKNWENDFEIVPISWQNEIYENTKRKLRIGYTKSHYSYPACTSHQRAVQESINALKSKGHEVIELEFLLFEELTTNFLELLASEGQLRSTIQQLNEEPPIDEYKQIFIMAKLPNFMIKILVWLLKFLRQTRLSKILATMSEKTAWEYFKCSETQLLLKENFSNWWNKNKLDAYITPGFGIPAVKHGTSQDLFIYCCYNFVWNSLDYPVGSIPITKTKKEEEEFIDQWNRHDMIHDKVKECCKDSMGLPVGIQVVTKPFQEELCLFVMKEIEDVVKFHEYANI